jgi:hypothetical protein
LTGKAKQAQETDKPKEVISCIDSDGGLARPNLNFLNARIARTPWIMLPAQNSGQKSKNTASTKNLVQNEYQKNERKEGDGRETKSKPANSGLRKFSFKAN